MRQPAEEQQALGKMSPLQRELMSELIFAMSSDQTASPFRIINQALDFYWPSPRHSNPDKSTIVSALKNFNKHKGHYGK